MDFNRQKEGQDIPDLFYAVYQNIIAISLFNHEAHLFSHSLDNQHNLEEIEQVLNGKTSAAFGFKKKGGKRSNLTDKQFIEFVIKGKEHCYRGDVFQLVLSRRFSQSFCRR